MGFSMGRMGTSRWRPTRVIASVTGRRRWRGRACEPGRTNAKERAIQRGDTSAMNEWKHIRIELDEELAVVVVDRQEKLNALNAEVIDELGQAFASLEDDEEVLGVIVAGAGDKAFVAGADISELAEMDPLSAVEVSRKGQTVFGRIEKFPKPVLAAVGGYALGGGCELALACHMRVASENARFGLPEVGLGIMPGYGGTVRLARLIGLGRAVEMTLTGDMIDAETAGRYGLVGAVLSQEDLLDGAKRALRNVTKNGPVAVRMALESVYNAADVASAEALAFESSVFGVLASTEDMKEGMRAFMEKRRADFKGK